ncbi:MAG: HIT family protein, partial [Candidatus Paceibacterota bacterium]
LYQSKHFFIVPDKYPVSEGHLLIISKQNRLDFFELTEEEKKELPEQITVAKTLIKKTLIKKTLKPTGYNIGINCGASAGQTVFHFHCHVIPRYEGDMEDPRGGVRHSIEGKGYY